jgi:hypothetical protein
MTEPDERPAWARRIRDERAAPRLVAVRARPRTQPRADVNRAIELNR